MPYVSSLVIAIVHMLVGKLPGLCLGMCAWCNSKGMS